MSVPNHRFSVQVTAPTFEQHHDGFGVQFARPRISWRFSCDNKDVKDWVQTDYELQIRIIGSNETESFHFQDQESTLVPWPPQWPDLRSRERRYLRVRCYGECKRSGETIQDITEWSPWATVEAALLDRTDWSAAMIVSAHQIPPNVDGSARPLVFWKSFLLPQGARITSARLYATSHGVYQASINGRHVGDHCMAPGWQSYDKRMHYQIFDVVDLLNAGCENLIQIDVAPGWFASALTWAMRRFIYGKELGVFAQLEVFLAGHRNPTVISTDETWLCSTSMIISSEIYAGEVCDQRVTHPSAKSRSQIYRTKNSPTPVPALISPNAPPVRVTERLRPIKIFKSKSGKPIIDFGQNMAGRVCIRNIQKPAGTKVVFRHAEIMQDGELGTRQLRGAAATDTLICDGTPIKKWWARFTFHGFRYVEVAQGWSTEDSESPLTIHSLRAEVLHSDMRRTGWFSCSDPEVNRLHENAVWSMRSNFLSVPTDDPQRDERLGWTGDLNVFCQTANYLYDTAGILGNWLEDLYADQMDEDEHWYKGVVPLVVPNCIKKKSGEERGWETGWDPMPNGVWGDAAIMVPWKLYLFSNDKSILERQYPSMVAYLDRGVVRGPDGLWDDEVWQFGDWLDPSAPVNDSGRGRTDGTFVADCYLVKSTFLMELIRKFLDKEEPSEFYLFYKKLEEAFDAKYSTQNGVLAPDTPTAYALALSLGLDLVSKDPVWLRQVRTERLVRALRLNDFLVPTGFVGTAHLLHALAKENRPDIAYAMILARGVPSLLHPVRLGATTIWERWDAMKANGSVNEGIMTSFNHYALGSVVGWLYQCCAGLGDLHFRLRNWKGVSFEIRPLVHHALDRAVAMFDSRVGMLEVGWKFKMIEEKRFVHLDVVMPPNARAQIMLPTDVNVVTEDADKLEDPSLGVWWVGSGRHHFEWEYKQVGDWPVKPLLPPWKRREY